MALFQLERILHISGSHATFYKILYFVFPKSNYEKNPNDCKCVPLEMSVTSIEWQSPRPHWPFEPLWQPWLIKDLSYIKLQNLHCLLGLVHYDFGDDESDCIVLLSLMIEWQWTQQLTQTSVWELPYLESCSTPIGKYSASEMPGWSRSPETKAVFDIIW